MNNFFDKDIVFPLLDASNYLEYEATPIKDGYIYQAIAIAINDSGYVVKVPGEYADVIAQVSTVRIRKQFAFMSGDVVVTDEPLYKYGVFWYNDEAYVYDDGTLSEKLRDVAGAIENLNYTKGVL